MKKIVLLSFLSLFIRTLHAQPPFLHIYKGLPCGLAAPATQVIYGNGHYLACIRSPTRLYLSIDGDSAWEQTRETPSLSDPVIAFGRNAFVAVGDSGKIYTSPNGESWTRRSSGTTANLKDIQFLGGTFYAVGDSASLLRSSDGRQWTRLSTGVGVGTDSYRGIVYGDSALVINSLTAAGATALVQKNSSWKAIPLAVPSGVLRFLKDRFYFLAPQSTLSSTDAFATINVSMPGTFPPVPLATDGFYDGSRIFLMGQNALYPSEDGIFFNFSYSLPAPASGVEYIHNHYFAHGIYGIQRSDNSVDWSPLGGNFVASATNGQNFAAAGYWQTPTFFFGAQGLIASSTDGLRWRTRQVTDQSMAALIYDGTRYLALGGSPYASADGIAWSQPPGAPFYVSLAAYGGGLTLISDGAAFYRSANGSSFDFIAGPGMRAIRRLRFVNGRFYAVGSNNNNGLNYAAVFVSADGINWTDISPQLPFNARLINDVIYDGHKYYLIGLEQANSGQQLDFFTVSVTDIDNPASYGPKGGVSGAAPALGGENPTIAWHNGHFVGGVSDSSGYGYLIYSSDGLKWNTIPLDALSSINSVVVKEDVFAVLGTNNVSAVLRFPISPLPGHDSSGAMRVYPNPAPGQVTVWLPAASYGKDITNRVRLYSAGGVLLRSGEFSGNQISLSLRGIPAGILHVVVETGGRTYSKELLHR